MPSTRLFFPALLLLFCLQLQASMTQDSVSVTSLMAMQDYQSALRLLSKQDSTLDRQILIGTCEYRLGTWKHAKETLQNIIRKDTFHLGSNVMLASIYDQEFNMPKAIKHYSILIQLDSTNPTYVKNLARAHAKAGLHRLAKDLYWEARALNESDITILVSLADQAFREKEWVVADSLADVGLALDSSNLQITLTKARASYARKQYLSTTKYLERTRGKLDLLPFYQKMLGYAYLQLDSLDKSIHVLENLLYREESEHTHFYLALAYQKKEDAATSIHHYEKAIDQGISGSLGKYFGGLAKMYKQENKLKEAIVAYGEAYTYSENHNHLFQKAQLSEQYYRDKAIALRLYRQCVATKQLHADQLAFANDRIRLLKEYLHQSKN
ncbi:MAG: hypothetical protein KTR24_10490 [Saprospiraceae bacterium]|nr:hypothetical protein [Saprospiraceae bacterium]